LLARHGVPFHLTFVFKNGIHGDEKELNKANLHGNGIFVSFCSGNVFFKQLEMLWIMKRSLLGKFTGFIDISLNMPV